MFEFFPNQLLGVRPRTLALLPVVFSHSSLHDLDQYLLNYILTSSQTPTGDFLAGMCINYVGGREYNMGIKCLYLFNTHSTCVN